MGSSKLRNVTNESKSHKNAWEQNIAHDRCHNGYVCVKLRFSWWNRHTHVLRDVNYTHNFVLCLKLHQIKHSTTWSIFVEYVFFSQWQVEKQNKWKPVLCLCSANADKKGKWEKKPIMLMITPCLQKRHSRNDGFGCIQKVGIKPEQERMCMSVCAHLIVTLGLKQNPSVSSHELYELG